MDTKHITKYLTIGLFCTSSFLSFAKAAQNQQYFLDVYKSRQVTSKQIYEKFKPEFDELAKIDVTHFKGMPNERMKAINLKIRREVSQIGNFSYINFAPVWYPLTNKIYYSIDLVDTGDKRLISFYSKPEGNFPDPDNLIKSWNEYEKTMLENKLYTTKSCPVFHCLSDFEHPSVKKYLTIFNEGVPKAEAELIQILKNDRDDEKRATAAFLLAHIKDGKKLIKTLVPAMRDPSPDVRNNVMRVLGMALQKLKTVDFPIQEAIAALDFPASTDRNKTMLIIFALSEQPRYKKYLIKHASNKLIEELKFNAPNIHDAAYYTLQRISGQKYAERDYKSWENWLKNHQ